MNNAGASPLGTQVLVVNNNYSCIIFILWNKQNQYTQRTDIPLGLSFAPSGMLKQNEEPRFIVGYAEPTTEELDTFDLDTNGNVILTNKRVVDTTNAYFGDGQWMPGKNGPTYEGLMSGSG